MPGHTLPVTAKGVLEHWADKGSPRIQLYDQIPSTAVGIIRTLQGLGLQAVRPAVLMQRH